MKLLNVVLATMLLVSLGSTAEAASQQKKRKPVAHTVVFSLGLLKAGCETTSQGAQQVFGYPEGLETILTVTLKKSGRIEAYVPEFGAFGGSFDRGGDLVLSSGLAHGKYFTRIDLTLDVSRAEFRRINRSHLKAPDFAVASTYTVFLGGEFWCFHSGEYVGSAIAG